MKITIDGRDYDTTCLESISRYRRKIGPRFFRRYPKKDKFDTLCISLRLSGHTRVVRARFWADGRYDIVRIFNRYTTQDRA